MLYTTGAPSKKSEKEEASSVADITTILSGGHRDPSGLVAFRSRRRACIPLSVPRRKSVCSVRSCASSIITTPYLLSSGSVIASRSSIPSVRNFIFVPSLLTSSKRMA